MKPEEGVIVRRCRSVHSTCVFYIYGIHIGNETYVHTCCELVLLLPSLSVAMPTLMFGVLAKQLVQDNDSSARLVFHCAWLVSPPLYVITVLDSRRSGKLKVISLDPGLTALPASQVTRTHLCELDSPKCDTATLFPMFTPNAVCFRLRLRLVAPHLRPLEHLPCLLSRGIWHPSVGLKTLISSSAMKPSQMRRRPDMAFIIPSGMA